MRNKYSTSSELRTKARVALRDRWVTAIVAALIVSCFGGMFTVNYGVDDTDSPGVQESLQAFEYNVDQYVVDGDLEGLMNYVFTEDFVWVLMGVTALVALLSAVYGIFVGIPLNMGYYRFNHDLFKKKKTVSLNALLAMFREGYWRSIGVNFRVALRLLGTYLAGYALTFAVVFVGAIFATATTSAFFLAFFVLVASIIFMIFTVKVILMALSYSMVPHILVDHPEMDGREILARSKKLMQGNRWRYFKLGLSFMGWVAGAVVFTCGLGLVAVVPYMAAAETAFYRELVRGGKRPHLLAMMKNR